MKKLNKLMFLCLFIYLISCSAEVNVTKGEMNVKQGDTGIPCDTGYFNFGNIPLNFSQSITFTIENVGVSDLNLTGNPKVEVSGQNASDFYAVANSTASTIAAESETTFKIHFKPTSLGAKTATVSIANDDKKKNPYTFAIVGTCTPPAPEIHVKQGDADILSTTGSFDFGTVIVNESSPTYTFTIENNGNEILNLTGIHDKITLSGTDKIMFQIDQNDVQSTISANNSTTFDVLFAPTSPGIKTAKINILNDDSDENPYTFTITGTGVASPEINVKQGTNNIPNGSGKFGLADTLVNETSAEVTFTIENLGTSTLQVTGIDISGSDAAMFSKNTSTTNENTTPGNSTTFTIAFAPTSTGVKSATVSIANNDNDENPYIFTVEAKGVTPEINVKQGSTNILNGTSTYDFGLTPVGGSSSEVTFTIENLGDGNLKLDGSPKVDKAGTDAAMFEINDTSTVSPVTPGHTTIFTIKFTPADGGNKSATISIANNDDDENPYTFTVTGEGENGAAFGWIGGGSNGWKTGAAPSSGSDYQSFYNQNGICLDSSGNIYVADTKNNRITKWDKDGNAIGWIGGGSNGWKTGTAPSSGSDYQSFYNPKFVVVDTVGYIYVSDAKNNRICKWDSSGDAVGWIGGGSNGWKTSTAPSTYGADYRSFYYPVGIAVDSSGNIYISDNSNHRISKWDKDGNAIGWIGGGSNGWKTTTAVSAYGTDYQSLTFPGGVSLDSSGNIFVADSSNYRVSKWDKTGNAIGWIGGGSNGWKTTTAPSYDSDYQSFYAPTDVILDSIGLILVADAANHRICKWDSSGNAIGWIGSGSNGWKTHSNPHSGTDYQSFMGVGSVYTDLSGNIFVSDVSNNRICKWHD